MFVHPRLKTVTVFTQPALPGFFVIPTVIPNQTLLWCTPSHGCAPYSLRFQPRSKNCLAAWFAPAHRVLLDAVCDPGVVNKCSSLTPLLLLPASFSRALAHPNLLYNGAYYQIQRLTLHLAASVQLRVSPASLAAEFPLLALSIASRVPSCRLVAVTHFDEHTRWLTTPFLRGFPPP
jgi:hypothetical protein